MIEHLSMLWNSLAPAIGNHLWQSTLVALAAATLTLAVRKHNARIRHFLWLAASLKFLVPFSLLIGLGKLFAWRSLDAAPQKATVFYAIEQIGLPFAQTGIQVTPQHNLSAAPAVSVWLPWLGSIWLAGFIGVTLLWTVRWFRISAQMKSAELPSQGRELDILRRVERIGGLRNPIALFLSRTSLEPGIFGIARPVLLWPEGISKHLHDAQLEAILAHEVWHVRRRDNLFAVLHMFVEAIFWFYPPVWWIGSRLVDERERACDEEVVASGSDRQVYAESILKVCEFCLGSPLPCVAGVTGADLKKRMVHIMNDRILHKLDFARKLLLTAAAFLAIAVPITFGLFHATPIRAQSHSDSASATAPMFESVSIKPNNQSGGKFYSKLMFSLEDGSFTARGITLQRLIEMAYHVQDSQLSGGPDWLNSQKFDIDAKMNSAVAEALRNQGSPQNGFDDQIALKTLLAHRFNLALHPEARSLSVYDLVIADGGSRLKESQGQSFIHLERGELNSSGVPVHILTEQLSQILGQTVIDKTGLTSNYAFTLRWTPDASEDARFRKAEAAMMVQPPPGPKDTNAPPLAVALEQQLGLKLEQVTNNAVQVLVIDHAEAPSGN